MTELPELQPNKYDNDVTLLYKRSQGTIIPTTLSPSPSRFLFRYVPEDADPVIEDLGLDYDSVFYTMDTYVVDVVGDEKVIKDENDIAYREIASNLRINTHLSDLDMAYVYLTSLRDGPDKYRQVSGPVLAGYYLTQYASLSVLVDSIGLAVPSTPLPAGLGVPDITAYDYFEMEKDQSITSVTHWFRPPTLAFLAALYGKSDRFGELYRMVGSVDPRQINQIHITYILEDREAEFDLDNIRKTQDEILARVNRFLAEIDNSTQYASYELLMTGYREWLSVASTQAESEMGELSQIAMVQSTLSQVDTAALDPLTLVPLSPLTLDDSTYSFSPKLDGVVVSPGDGLDIFDKSIPSMFVPHIKYVDETGRSYHRVYEGDKSHPNFSPNYGRTLLPDSKDRPNTLYLSMWTGVNPALFSRAVKDDFYVVEYRLDFNYMKVRTAVGNGKRESEDVAILRLKQSLPTLDFGPETEVNVSANFLIWGEALVPSTASTSGSASSKSRIYQSKEIWLEMSSLLEMLLLDDVMNEYLYLEESSRPYALKKQLKLHYRAMFGDQEGQDGGETGKQPSIVFSLSNKTANNNLVVKARDYSHKIEHQIDVPRGLNYYYVSVTNAESKKVLHRFMLILQLLLRYYVIHRDRVYNEIYSRIPQLVSAPGQVEVSQISISRIQALKEAYPELFGNSYPSTCIAKNQPMVISADEVEFWRTQRPIGGLPREIATLHNEQGEEINLVCPDDRYPYIGNKRNTKTDRDVLCCRKSRVVGERSQPASKSNRIITSRITDPNGLGSLPTGVDGILWQISRSGTRSPPPWKSWSRYGVIVSPNSFLHCVLIAIEDNGYFSSRGSEEYVKEIRSKIVASSYPKLLSQELYDYTEAEILEAAGDLSNFFDPALFYRAVEEYYNINIYTFSRREKSDPVGYLEIPRYRLFHSRPTREDRPTVMIYKSIGSKRDNLEYPHCELVVADSVDPIKNTPLVTKYFGPEITTGIHRVMMASLRTYTFEIGQEIVAHANLGYIWDTLGSTGSYSVVSQHVDPNGKLRVIDLLINGKEVSLVTPPTQPENLPQRSGPLHPILSSDAISLFGQPSARSSSGLWFSTMGLQQGIYVAVSDHTSLTTGGLANLPLVSSPDTVEAEGRSSLNRMTKMRRTVNIILELVGWLFSLAEKNNSQDPNFDARKFSDKYFVVIPRDVDSSEYYDLSRLDRRLPKTTNIETALKQLESTIPSLVSNGSILMYSHEFARRLTENLDAQDPLAQYSDVVSNPLSSEHLVSYFQSASDFRTVPNSKVFTSDQALKTWRAGLNLEKNNLTVATIIPPVYPSLPIIYRDKAGRMFLIQGVTGGNKDTALAVGYIWQKYHVNPGPVVESLTFNPAHVIYGISSTGELEVFKDNTVVSSSGVRQPFLTVLYYNTKAELNKVNWGQYAAMLRLL
jgi:hypothetical protein